jgi:hypothetical protein
MQIVKCGRFVSFVFFMTSLWNSLVSGKPRRLHLMCLLIFVCANEEQPLLRSLIWEQLTGREHLRFYGRLKNLTGTALKNVSVLSNNYSFYIPYPSFYLTLGW